MRWVALCPRPDGSIYEEYAHLRRELVERRRAIIAKAQEVQP